MDVMIGGSGVLRGVVTVPGSKSYTHRVVAAASLCGGRTIIENPSNSEANCAMIRACEQLGASVRRTGGGGGPGGDVIEVTGTGGRPRAAAKTIDMGNSGTALRIVTSMASLAAAECRPITITGDPSLRGRPMKPLLDALRALGADISGVARGGEEYAPVTVGAGGGLDGGGAQLSCGKSSQYLSSLLIAGCFAGRDVEIDVTGQMVSRPYVEMTLEVLRRFGLAVKSSPDLMRHRISAGGGGGACTGPGTYRIPGDYSQSAFFLAAACLAESDVRVRGLDPGDKQGDRMIVDVLRTMGAVIEQDGGDLLVRGPFELRGTDVDLVDAPDLFPVLAVLGAYASGRTRLYNMPQIRSKETDRIAVMERELGRYGVRTESGADEMTVYHGGPVRPAPGAGGGQGAYVFDAAGEQGVTDHRVAMALSLIGIRSGRALIRDAGGIAVSYPDYLDHMEGIGVRVDRLEDRDGARAG